MIAENISANIVGTHEFILSKQGFLYMVVTEDDSGAIIALKYLKPEFSKLLFEQLSLLID